MSQNGQTYFKNLEVYAAKYLMCLTILRHYALQGEASDTYSLLERNFF